MSGQLGLRQLQSYVALHTSYGVTTGTSPWLQLPAFQQENHKQNVIAAAVKCSAQHSQSVSSRSHFSEPPASGRIVRAAAFANAQAN